MNRRGFFSAIASAVAAGIVIPRESIIVQPERPPFMIAPGVLDLNWEQWSSQRVYAYTTDEETSIHVRRIPDGATLFNPSGPFLFPRIEEMTRAEFAKRYPPAIGRLRFLHVDV